MERSDSLTGRVRLWVPGFRRALKGMAFILFLVTALHGFCDVRARQEDDDLKTRAIRSLENGIAFLLDQQGEDGLWHSAHYGNLREGAGVTALVLEALAQNHQRLPEGALERMQEAIEVLSPTIDEFGYVANKGGPDYSNYSSALILEADRVAGLKLSAERRRKLVEYLVRAQLDEPEGFAPGHCDYGGWDLTGWMTGKRPTTGTNVSVSTFVIAALCPHREAAEVRATLSKAGNWLEGCRNSDGGFHFHPQIDHDGNKAGWTSEQRTVALSYGTCSADGLRALIALEVPVGDPRVAGAIAWLEREIETSTVPGFRNDADGETWKTGLRYYYLAALARVLHLLAPDHIEVRGRAIMELLVESQDRDGSWRNAGARMREDDPLIATSFAIGALRQVVDAGNREER